MDARKLEEVADVKTEAVEPKPEPEAEGEPEAEAEDKPEPEAEDEPAALLSPLIAYWNSLHSLHSLLLSCYEEARRHALAAMTAAAATATRWTWRLEDANEKKE